MNTINISNIFTNFFEKTQTIYMGIGITLLIILNFSNTTPSY